jgi:mRNA interferase MazF
MPAASTGLSKDSVANVTQIITLDLDYLAERAGRIPASLMAQVDAGLTLVRDPNGSIRPVRSRAPTWIRCRR